MGQRLHLSICCEGMGMGMGLSFLLVWFLGMGDVLSFAQVIWFIQQ